MLRQAFTLGSILPLLLLAGCGGEAPSAESEAAARGSTAGSTPKAAPGDWPTWRGPNLNNVARDEGSPPLEWSATKNVVWKTEVPGRGHSSPSVVGDRIFLTTSNDDQQTQSVLGFDRQTGKLLWQTRVNQGGFPKRIHRKNTHASPSPACDGEHVFATFYNHDGIQLVALDLEGNQVWSERVGRFEPKRYQYGYAPSPMFSADTVLVAGDYEGGGWIAAHDRRTGKRVWKTDRPKRLSYSSPVVTHIAGREQLLISGCDVVAAYDPATGNQLWSTPATTMATCGTMVWDGELAFASGGYPDAGTYCVRADGSGEVVWRNGQKCYEQSLLAHDGYVYAFTDGGVAFCWRAADGKQMWAQRLEGPVSASPVLANGHVYATNEKGRTFVFEATPEDFQRVATNRLGDESFASLAVAGGRIYARVAHDAGGRQEVLYCLGRAE